MEDMKRCIRTRKLTLKYGGQDVPVFVGNPDFKIGIRDTSDIGDDFNLICRSKVKEYLDSIKGSSIRFQAGVHGSCIRSKKLFTIIKDDDIITFGVTSSLLDYLAYYSMKYNCIDAIMVECLDKLGKLILPEVPNLAVSKDVKAVLESAKKPIHFRWN